MNKDKKLLTFANIIIVICVVASIIITVCVLYEYHRLNTVLPAGVLTALLGFWGGELLIIALRQIFGSDVILQARNDYYDDDENYP